MALQTLFPTYIYYEPLKKTGLTKLNKEIKTEAYQLQDVDDEGIYWSANNYVGGYTSYSSYSELHNFSSTFKALQEEIDKHVKNYVEKLEYDINSNELAMSSCWVNIMPGYTSHSMHIHPLSVISGTYYVEVPKDASGIKFEDPRLDKFMAAPPKKASAKKKNQTSYSIKSKPGSLVLFESWLRHEVPASTSEEDRISISFNYDWN